VKQIRKRITYANVMSSIAVFLVLGGGAAYAAKKIGSNEIKGNSITTGKIKKEAVTAAKIKNSSVTTAKIANNAVTTAKIANSAVSTDKIADSAVTNGKLANGSVSASKLASGFVAPTAEKLARFANISSAGVVLSGSQGIAQANVTKSGNFYCIGGLSPAPVGGVATIDYNQAGSEEDIQLGIGAGGGCPAGNQVFVDPRNGGTPVSAGFFVVLY
jgi:hypothetical protein